MIEIRQLFDLARFEEVVRLQQEIWGFPDLQLLPARFLVVVSHIGGHVLGAFDLLHDGSSPMVGFCCAVPGIKPDGRPYLYSQVLGVLPQYRDARIGRRLKLRQREDALARGIELIEWTFDPLELKNAFFNIERLGAIVRRYAENQYGVTASPLHGGLPTDRCIAEWWIASPRVQAALEDQLVAPPDGVRIWFPADIARIRGEDPERAREIQQANAARFQRAFDRGLVVTRFTRSETAGTYFLEPWL